jgi:hypothetical protein
MAKSTTNKGAKMKTVALNIMAATLAIFCLACEEKEKAKAEADEVAKTETAAKPIPTDTVLIDETGIIFNRRSLFDSDADAYEGEFNEDMEVVSSSGYYAYETSEKFKKLGIKKLYFDTEKVRYLSFALGKDKRSVLDVIDKDKSFTALLYKKGKEPIEVGLEGHDWEKIAKYLQMNLKDVNKKLGYIVKLLQSITDENGVVQKQFEYDDQNRVVKIYGKNKLKDFATIAYTDNSVTVENFMAAYNGSRITKFVIDGNAITVAVETSSYRDSGTTLTVNDGGYIIKDKFNAYQYQDNNLTGNGESTYYKYDSKNSPFSNSNTPKWLIQFLPSDFSGSNTDASKNNLIESGEPGDDLTGTIKIEYKYDSEEFPTKKMEKTFMYGQWMATTTSFTYFDK